VDLALFPAFPLLRPFNLTFPHTKAIYRDRYSVLLSLLFLLLFYFSIVHLQSAIVSLHSFFFCFFFSNLQSAIVIRQSKGFPEMLPEPAILFLSPLLRFDPIRHPLFIPCTVSYFTNLPSQVSIYLLFVHTFCISMYHFHLPTSLQVANNSYRSGIQVPLQL